MMRSSSIAIALIFSVVACTKDWTDRELVPVTVNLDSSGTYTLAMPSGLKRTSEPGVLGVYEGDDMQGPLLYLAALSFSDDNADAYIAGSKDGSAFQKREVPNGFGISYESNGPHVHVVRKIGAKFLTCDGSFPGGTKDNAKRADLIWRICSSMK